MHLARRLSACLILGTAGSLIYTGSLLVEGGSMEAHDGAKPMDAATEASGPPCKSGTSDCASGSVRSCVDGKWVVEQVCSNGCDADGGCNENPSCTGGGPGADQTCGPMSTTDCCKTL